MKGGWYYGDPSHRQGPVSWEQLQELAHGGHIRATTLVTRQDQPKWSLAREVPGLFIVGDASNEPGQPPPLPAVPVARSDPPQTISYFSRNDSVHMTRDALHWLTSTRPWVLFPATLLLISASLSALGGVSVLCLYYIDSDRFKFPVSVPLCALVSAAVSGVTALSFFNFAKHIKATSSACLPKDLEAAMYAQWSLWRIQGILLILALVVMAGAFLYLSFP